METTKLQFSNDVLQIIRHLSKVAFNIQSDEQIENLFGMKDEKIEAVIKNISDALPETVFHQTAQTLDEIKNIFAREFIFFQVQEKETDPQYKDDLSKFIQIFSRDIQKRIAMKNNKLVSKGEGHV